MKTYQLLTAMVLFIFYSTALFAQTAKEVELKDRPGYIDLSEIEIPVDASEITEISLGPPLLRMITRSHVDGDEELSETLESIFSIQVKSFELNEEQAKKMKPIIEKLEKKIYNDNWMKLVQVKSKNELTIVAIKYIDKMACGLFAMSINPGHESSFVNIVGNINLDKLGDLHLGDYSSALDSLKFHSHDDD